MSAGNVLVYWMGIVGIPGKGPNYMAPYSPNETIGEVIEKMRGWNLGERNKRIEILKYKGAIDKYDRNNPYWEHSATVLDYVNYHGGKNQGVDVFMVYCIV
jgi:hypothetical protein